MLKPENLFDLSNVQHAALFDGLDYVWQAIPRLGDYLAEKLATTHKPNAHEFTFHPSTVLDGDDIYIGNNVQIDPGAYLSGKIILEDDVQVRHGALLRGNVLVASGGIVGHTTEVKNATFLPGAGAPHFAYIGDSILGANVNLGAGTKLSNFPLNFNLNSALQQPPTIGLKFNGETIDTGLSKFGAVLGDGVQLGCNTVTNPGTIIGANTLVYALTLLRKGYYPANSVIKNRPAIEIVERR